MAEKTISLPRLNHLQPTLESTALKLMEEAGELAEAIGKFRGANGEEPDLNWLQRTVEELMDVAQTAVSMMFVLEETHGVSIPDALEDHRAKLIRKGYYSP